MFLTPLKILLKLKPRIIAKQHNFSNHSRTAELKNNLKSEFMKHL